MKHTPLTPSLILLGSLILSLMAGQPVQAAPPITYTAGVHVGDWWNYSNFEGSCQTPCPSGFQATINIAETTSIVVAQPNSTSVRIKNTVAFNNQTIRTFTTIGDLSTGKGNLSFVTSPLIAGGLKQGDPISKAAGAPLLNGTTTGQYAGANRTLNILNDLNNQRIYQWDQTTGLLVSYSQNQPTAHLYYRLTGTNLWHYKIAIYDGICGPDSPVSCGYDPIQATIITGTTVAFSNTGTATHSVYSCTTDHPLPYSPEGCNFVNYPTTAPSFDSGPIAPGTVWNLTFPVPGEIYYFDTYNPNMKAVVTVLGNATTPPGFTITGSPNPVVVPQGLAEALTISASGTNGYTGPVTFSGVFQTGPNYPRTNGAISETGFFYGGGWGFGVSVAVITRFDTPLGIYNVTLTGTGNNLTVTTTVPIIVVAPAPSFYITPYGNSSISMVSGQATSLNVTVHSVAGFTGPITLTSYAYGNLFASISPQSISLQPNSSVNATLTLNSGYPGNYTVGIFAYSQDVTLDQRTYLNVNVRQVIGLLLYQLFYFGAPYPGSSLLLVNSFTNIGNIPDRALYGTISIDFGTYPFTVIPLRVLQPNETLTYNITITVPAGTKPGNYTVTATLTWEALLTEFWTRAPPLVLHGQLQVTSLSPSPPTSSGTNAISDLMRQLGNSVLAFKDYWVWALAIYTPPLIVLSSIIVLREKKRNRDGLTTNTPENY